MEEFSASGKRPPLTDLSPTGFEDVRPVRGASELPHILAWVPGSHGGAGLALYQMRVRNGAWQLRLRAPGGKRVDMLVDSRSTRLPASDLRRDPGLLAKLRTVAASMGGIGRPPPDPDADEADGAWTLLELAGRHPRSDAGNWLSLGDLLEPPGGAGAGHARSADAGRNAPEAEAAAVLLDARPFPPGLPLRPDGAQPAPPPPRSGTGAAARAGPAPPASLAPVQPRPAPGAAGALAPPARLPFQAGASGAGGLPGAAVPQSPGQGGPARPGPTATAARIAPQAGPNARRTAAAQPVPDDAAGIAYADVALRVEADALASSTGGEAPEGCDEASPDENGLQAEAEEPPFLATLFRTGTRAGDHGGSTAEAPRNDADSAAPQQDGPPRDRHGGEAQAGALPGRLRVPGRRPLSASGRVALRILEQARRRHAGLLAPNTFATMKAAAVAGSRVLHGVDALAAAYGASLDATVAVVVLTRGKVERYALQDPVAGLPARLDPDTAALLRLHAWNEGAPAAGPMLKDALFLLRAIKDGAPALDRCYAVETCFGPEGPMPLLTCIEPTALAWLLEDTGSLASALEHRRVTADKAVRVGYVPLPGQPGTCPVPITLLGRDEWGNAAVLLPKTPLHLPGSGWPPAAPAPGQALSVATRLAASLLGCAGLGCAGTVVRHPGTLAPFRAVPARHGYDDWAVGLVASLHRVLAARRGRDVGLAAPDGSTWSLQALHGALARETGAGQRLG